MTMKRLSKHPAVAFLWLVAVAGCDLGSGPDGHEGFAIYLLKDPSYTAAVAWSQPLESLTLAEDPILTTDDVRVYHWQTHEFAVSARADSQLATFRRTLGPTGGIPFVVVVGTERIYLGAFWYGYSSMICQVPFIDALGNLHRINKCESILVTEDRRTDPRVYLALRAVGVLVE